ncbi:hypothetical protein K488DRAFT_90781 [Vararia minispora EC-137]|uniref:Uncharacterized protein n=1 Tax=Vararia minispora EC-137 TaxID=1314806 RepID=A0ACB8Q747_9AGAM|nr:hypothetical protein K488DRAFT_90781 [Vararia minispora EC-137]
MFLVLLHYCSATGQRHRSVASAITSLFAEGTILFPASIVSGHWASLIPPTVVTSLVHHYPAVSQSSAERRWTGREWSGCTIFLHNKEILLILLVSVDSVAQPRAPDLLAMRLLDELEHAIQGLPTSIPEAAPGDDVYSFAEWGIDVPKPELAWMCLNKALDGLVRYDHNAETVSTIVRRGQWGFMHVVQTIRSFATTYPEVIEGVLLEPKI